MLQRFYGGRPRDWLAMPVGVVRHYIAEKDVLEARERLMAMTMALIASGNTKAHEVKRIRRHLERAAKRPGERRAQRFDSLSGVRSMGIGVVMEG